MQLVKLNAFERIIPSSLVENLALKYQVDRCNQIKLSGLAVFSCLLQTILNNHITTQRALEEMYYMHTGETADHSSFGKRLSKIPICFFQAIFEHLFKQLVPLATPGQINTLRLRYVDATTVTLSAQLIKFGLLYSHTGQSRTGKPHRAIKTVFSLTDEGLPSFLRLAKNPEENSDSKALGLAIQQAIRPNDLWVFDAGCHDRFQMLGIHNGHAFFLTPHSTQKLNVSRVVWEAQPDQITDEPPKDHGSSYQLIRVEDARFGNRVEKNDWQQMPLVIIHGLRWDIRSSQWKPMVLMTNLPLSDDNQRAGPFLFTEVAQIYRRRWEIEKFFKFIKQHIGYSHIVSRTQNGLEVMIYMSLIATLLMIWYKSLTKIDRGWRSVKIWLANDANYWTRDLITTAKWIPP